jgi:hypothetical protein
VNKIDKAALELAMQEARRDPLTATASRSTMTAAIRPTRARTPLSQGVAASAMKLPQFVGRVIVSSTVATSSVNEGVGKPLRSLTLAASDITPKKVVSQIVMSKELIDGLGGEAMDALGNELRKSVGYGSDSEFLASLTGNAFDDTGPATFAGALDGMSKLARAVQTGSG